MAFTAIYSKKFANKARQEEGLSPAQAAKVLGELPNGWLNDLVAYINDTEFPDGAVDLRDWRQRFPSIIPGDDTAAYFVLRLAVNEAGGMVA